MRSDYWFSPPSQSSVVQSIRCISSRSEATGKMGYGIMGSPLSETAMDIKISEETPAHPVWERMAKRSKSGRTGY